MNKLIYIILFFTFLSAQNPQFNVLNISVSGNSFITDEDIINFSGLSNKPTIRAIDIQNSANANPGI